MIVNATDVQPNDIQKNIFFWLDGDPCPQPYQLNTSLLEPCRYLQGYDYFEGSEVAYIYACIFLCFVPLVCAAAGYGVVKLQNKRRRQLKIRYDMEFYQQAVNDHQALLEYNTFLQARRFEKNRES